jgi:preprotein translocase subunit SecB
LGVFDIRDLEAQVSEKWLSERCPMVLVPTDREHRARAAKGLR